jgi:hypothetical protein
MERITRMDRTIAKRLGDDLEKAAQEVAKKYGVVAARRSGSFSDMQFTTKIEFAITETADGKSPAQVEFERYAKIFGLEAEDYGKEIVLQAERFTIAGIRPKASKNCISIKRVSDGKGFVCSVEVVNRKLNRVAVTA